MEIVLILTIAVVIIIIWLSLMIERLYKFKQEKIYEIIKLSKKQDADELINELDEMLKQDFKREFLNKDGEAL